MESDSRSDSQILPWDLFLNLDPQRRKTHLRVRDSFLDIFVFPHRALPCFAWQPKALNKYLLNEEAWAWAQSRHGLTDSASGHLELQVVSQLGNFRNICNQLRVRRNLLEVPLLCVLGWKERKGS